MNAVIEGKVAKDDVWHLVVTKAAKRDTWRQTRPEGPMRASHTGIARQSAIDTIRVHTVFHARGAVRRSCELWSKIPICPSSIDPCIRMSYFTILASDQMSAQPW